VASGHGPVAGLAVSQPDRDFWRGRRVLLTGHTGFKGAWLSLWLQSLEAEVVGVSAGVPTEPSFFQLARVGDTMRSIAASVCDADAVCTAVESVAPQVVIHMAAQPIVRRSFDDPRETYETNVMGTVNVLDAVRLSAHDIRAVVVVTSDKCYENRESERAYREGDPLGGADPYSSSKACAELVTSAFTRSFFSGSQRPRVASARAGNVIGGGDWGENRLVPDVIRAASAADEIRVRNPASIRPWQHVLNPLSGYLLLAQALWDSPDHAGSWNFGPPEDDARPVGWIVERICELWPDELRWSYDDGPHPPEARYLKLDSSRARERLGWCPPVALDSALQSIVEWHRALGEKADMRALTLAQIDRFTSGG
jgi:CDP-glucose 4,6-dehydratase